MNELLSNAVKHGSGDIQVTFTNMDGVGRLEVADDGPGLPDDFDPDRSANTGLELVRTLAAWDLAGSVGYGNRPEGGACIVVEFPCPNPDAAGAIPEEAVVSGR